MTNLRLMVDVYHGTAAAMFLVELGLIWLQHANLTPSVEEEGNGCHPQYQHEDDDQCLLRPHHRHSCKRDNFWYQQTVVHNCWRSVYHNLSVDTDQH